MLSPSAGTVKYLCTGPSYAKCLPTESQVAPINERERRGDIKIIRSILSFIPVLYHSKPVAKAIDII